jgi:putative Mg2+ transporter-C (MgtC) family protein
MSFAQQLIALGEILLAALLGGVIGLERELADKPAGLRTHMLVSASAALLVVLGNNLVLEASQGQSQLVRTDPVRIIEAVIVGISFLGAGTIIRRERGGSVKGLTTAASILAAAAVGIAVAQQLFFLAIGVTIAILFINSIMNRVEKRLVGRIQEED